MTFVELNARIEASPDPVELRYLRDERLGILGVYAGMEPAPEQVEIVADQLFAGEDVLLIQLPARGISGGA